MCYLLLILFSLLFNFASAQSDSSWRKLPELRISGFADVFYAYDFNKPQTQYRQTFFYNHNRHNQFNLNLGFIKLALEHSKYRANFALQLGTYVSENYINEPGFLKNIFEANLGFSLTQQNTLWIDGGIFASHIGFESAISSENWTLTRSLLAENSPYFLSGAKLTFKPNEKWEAAIIICNGWQRIKHVQGNTLPGFSSQLRFVPNSHVTINWSTFIGTDDPDVERRMRYFNNLFGKFEISKEFGLIAGCDVGVQQYLKNSNNYIVWFSPVIIARYSFLERWAVAARAEYYHDPQGAIISTPRGAFKTSGLSCNLDYAPIKNVLCRVEARWLNSSDKIFERNNKSVDDNYCIAASVAINFDKGFGR
jgi:hypothetical protein